METRPHVERSELRRWIGAAPDVSVATTLGEDTVRYPDGEVVDVARVRIACGRDEPTDAWVSGWLATKRGPSRLPPILVVPGGCGEADRTVAAWTAKACDACVLFVDWMGRGESSDLGLDPSTSGDAFRFGPDGPASSYQVHNLRAFDRAIGFLLGRPDVDGDRLAVVGTSWGGFYSLLVASLDSRVGFVSSAFGCGSWDVECFYLWRDAMEREGDGHMEAWLAAFDPARRAHDIAADVYFETATNDQYFALAAAMDTYARILAPKALHISHNQNHATRPFGNQAFRVVRSWQGPENATLLPRVGRPRLVGPTPRVEVVAPADAEVWIRYACGAAEGSSGSAWASARARREGGVWCAEPSLVDVGRPVRFYAQVVGRATGLSSCSPVERIAPREAGVRTPNARFEPRFTVPDLPAWELPVGDELHPAIDVRDEGGFRSIGFTFSGVEGTRGVLFCLEGDLLALAGVDALALRVRVPERAHLDGLVLLLVCDYQGRDEQCYGVRLADLGRTFDRFERCVVPFARFVPWRTRSDLFGRHRPRPLRVDRLDGVGFAYSGGAGAGVVRIAEVEVVRAGGARSVARPEEAAGGCLSG